MAERAAAAAASAAEAAASGSGGGGLPAGLRMEDASALSVPGGRDGQTKIIREGGSGMVYSWSAAR